MRCVVVAMLGLGLAQSALAADYGTLRGSTGYEPPTKYRNWEGFYVGGQVGIGGGGANFGGEGSCADRHSLVDHTFWQRRRRSELVDGGKGRHRTRGAIRRIHRLQRPMGRRRPRPRSQLQSHGPVRRRERPDCRSTRRLHPGHRTADWRMADRRERQQPHHPDRLRNDPRRARAGPSDRFLPYLHGRRGARPGILWHHGDRVDGRTATGPATSRLRRPIRGPAAVAPRPATDKSNSLIYGWSAGLGMDCRADAQHLRARRIRVHPVLADEAEPQQCARRRRPEVLSSATADAVPFDAI